jgi:hemerythrin
MRNLLSCLILLLTVFLVSCNPSEQKSSEEIWFSTEADNALREEIFTTWTNYVDIIDRTIKAKTPEDYGYIVGRIDGLLQWRDHEIRRFMSLSNISQEVVDTVVAKEIQQPLYRLVDNMRNHLEEIKNYIEDNQHNEIHKHDKKMQEIIKTVKGLNGGSSNYLYDSNEKVETLKTIQDSNALIEELLTQKQ